MKSHRTNVMVTHEDFPIYTEIAGKDEWGKNSNLKLFTATVLIGKYVVGEPFKGKFPHSFFRVHDNEGKDDLAILKCFAIVETEDLSILEDEKRLFSVCESYAKPGIEVLKSWYDDEEDISVLLYEHILKKFEEDIKKMTQK